MSFTGIVTSRESVLRREREHGGGRPSVISRSRNVSQRSMQEMRQTCPRDEEEEKSSMMEKTFIGRMFLEALDKATGEAGWDVSDEAKAVLRRAFNASAMAATQSVPAKVHAQVESAVDPDGQYPLYYRSLGHSRVVGKNCTVRLKLSNTQQVCFSPCFFLLVPLLALSLSRSHPLHRYKHTQRTLWHHDDEPYVHPVLLDSF